MKEELRQIFDEQLELVLPELPPQIHELLKEVPLIVDDYPSAKIMRILGVRRRDHLCGLYSGIPLTRRSVEHSGQPTDVIRLFRMGIIAAAISRCGRLTEEELRHQIRLTILHEFGHYHGMDEEELEELGY
jgi:predicted Zn-dependent protease with MMP-like domain